MQYKPRVGACLAFWLGRRGEDCVSLLLDCAEYRDYVSTPSRPSHWPGTISRRDNADESHAVLESESCAGLCRRDHSETRNPYGWILIFWRLGLLRLNPRGPTHGSATYRRAGSR